MKKEGFSDSLVVLIHLLFKETQCCLLGRWITRLFFFLSLWTLNKSGWQEEEAPRSNPSYSQNTDGDGKEIRGLPLTCTHTHRSRSEQSLWPRGKAPFAYRKRDVRSWSPQGGKLGANRSDSTCQCRTAVGRQQAHPGEKNACMVRHDTRGRCKISSLLKYTWGYSQHCVILAF